MSRRKQAKPVKRVISDDEEDVEPAKKTVKLSKPSTSSSTPSPSTKIVAVSPSPLSLLEKSLKKFEPTKQAIPATSNSSGSLSALFNCIGKLNSGTSCETEGVASVLKCLQCGAGFSLMEQLVKHMQDTKHFSNLPKPFNNFVSQDHQKLYNIKSLKTPEVQLACIKCGEVPTNMDHHLREVHDIKKKADWMKSVQVISSFPATLQSPHIKQLMSLINTVAKKA